MSDFRYRVRLVQEECFSERLVPFADDRFMEFHKAGEEACDHMSAQYCARCGVTHAADTYEAVDVERGEPGADGTYQFRDIYPTRVDEWAHPELFE